MGIIIVLYCLIQRQFVNTKKSQGGLLDIVNFWHFDEEPVSTIYFIYIYYFAKVVHVFLYILMWETGAIFGQRWDMNTQQQHEESEVLKKPKKHHLFGAK